MSTDFSSDRSTGRFILASPDARTALIATGICALLLAAFYFLGGKHLITSRQEVEKFKKVAKQTNAGVQRAEEAVDAVNLKVDSIKKALENGDLNVLKGFQARFQDIDSALAQLAEKLDLVKRKAAEIDAEESVRRANAIAVHDLAVRVKNSLDEFQKTLSDQHEKYKTFLTDDRSRNLAADPQAVRKFRAIVAAGDISLRECNTWQRQLGEVLPRIKQVNSGEDPTATVTKSDQEFLQDLLTHVNRARENWLATEKVQDDRVADSVGSQPSTRTLDEAIREQERSEAVEASDELVARMNAAKEQERQRLGKLLEEYGKQTEKIYYDIKYEKERKEQLEAEETHHKLKHDNDEKSAILKRIQLERELDRDLPIVRQHLKPFIAQGYTFTGGDGNKGPVSLSELRSRGALDETRQGLERLLFVGGSSKNDRARGAFPMFIGGENGWRLTNKELLTRAQQYLIKYGELLVKRQLLAE